MTNPARSLSHIAPVFLDACVVVANAKNLEKSLAAAGATFTVRLRQMPYGTEFYVRDPDGYVLGFVEAATE